MSLKVMAIKPARGSTVHLHSPGYQPSARPRPHSDISAMCGAPVFFGNPTASYENVPLELALRWTALTPSPEDPRPSWEWCRNCLGHVVRAFGLEQAVLNTVAERQPSAPTGSV